MPRRAVKRYRTKPPSAAAHRGLIAAMRTLYQQDDPLSAEDLLAERERIRVAAEADAQRQASLPLAPKAGR